MVGFRRRRVRPHVGVAERLSPIPHVNTKSLVVACREWCLMCERCGSLGKGHAERGGVARGRCARAGAVCGGVARLWGGASGGAPWRAWPWGRGVRVGPRARRPDYSMSNSMCVQFSRIIRRSLYTRTVELRGARVPWRVGEGPSANTSNLSIDRCVYNGHKAQGLCSQEAEQAGKRER